MNYRIPDEALASAENVAVDINGGFIQADVRAWQDCAVTGDISPEVCAAIAEAMWNTPIKTTTDTIGSRPAEACVTRATIAADAVIRDNPEVDPVKAHYILYPRSHWHWLALAGITAATVAACVWF